jgi:hypothetical protein
MEYSNKPRGLGSNFLSTMEDYKEDVESQGSGKNTL